MTLSEILEEAYQTFSTFDLITMYIDTDDPGIKEAAKSVLRTRLEHFDDLLQDRSKALFIA